MRIAISGATGFIGGRLCKWFVDRGAEVRALARKPIDALDWAGRVHPFHGELPDGLDERAFEDGIDAFIHCAYQTRSADRGTAERTNMRGSERIVQLCRKHDVRRLVFLSSMSAHVAAQSYYGRSKLMVESLLDPSRDLIIRPGLVIGTGGIFWRLCELVRRFRVIPIFFGGGQLVQTIAVDDLCHGIGTALDRDLSGVLNLAEAEPVSVDELFNAIVRMLGTRVVRVQLSGHAVLFALGASERLGVRLPISSEELQGLRALRTFDVAASLQNVGLTPKRMPQSVEELCPQSPK
jgi:nucleoside-diphosphate-sugar epimerase